MLLYGVTVAEPDVRREDLLEVVVQADTEADVGRWAVTKATSFTVNYKGFPFRFSLESIPMIDLNSQ